MKDYLKRLSGHGSRATRTEGGQSALPPLRRGRRTVLPQLMRAVARALDSALENRDLSGLLMQQATLRESSREGAARRTLMPPDVLARLDGIDEAEPRKYKLKCFRVRAGFQLAARRQADRDSGQYKESECTARHHSRVRALEKVARLTGVLEEAPTEERVPPPPPREGPRVRTEYADVSIVMRV